MLIGLLLLIVGFGFFHPDDKQKTALSLVFFTILLVIFVYFAIYLIAPWNPAIHMRTSADRILMHVFPAFLFFIFTAIKIRTPGVY